MKTVKIVKVGNSAGIILTADVLAKLGVKVGDEVHLVDSPQGLTVSNFDAQFAEAMEAAERVMTRHKNVLRELANR